MESQSIVLLWVVGLLVLRTKNIKLKGENFGLLQ